MLGKCERKEFYGCILTKGTKYSTAALTHFVVGFALGRNIVVEYHLDTQMLLSVMSLATASKSIWQTDEMSVQKFIITTNTTAAEVEVALVNNTEMTANEKAAISAALARTRAFNWTDWYTAHPEGLTLTGATVQTIQGKDAEGNAKTFGAMALTTSAGEDAVIYLSSLFKAKVGKDGVAHSPSGELRKWAVGATDLDKAKAILATAQGKVLYPQEDHFVRTGKFGDYQDCVRSWTTIKPE